MELAKRCIGNDFKLFLYVYRLNSKLIVTDGEVPEGAIPEDLTSAKNIVLELRSAKDARSTILQPTINVNELKSEIQTEIQRLGEYYVVLDYDKDNIELKDGLQHFRTDRKVFEIVKTMDQYTVGDVTVIGLVRAGQDGINGKSNYELAVYYSGFTGTEAEYIEWTRKPAVDAAALVDSALSGLNALELFISGNESGRQQSELTRERNETTRGEGENARNGSETSRGLNETERQQAEATRLLNETNRQQKESERQLNEGDRQASETNRGNKEQIREENETARELNESGRSVEETKRVDEETVRVGNENTRKANETEREESETTRGVNEGARNDNETARKLAETTRDGNENARKGNENARQIKETERQAAETSRQSGYSTISGQIAQLGAEMNENIEPSLAEILNAMAGRIIALESIIKNSVYKNMQVDTLDIVKGFSIYGSTNLVLTGTAAPSVVPDFVGQFYVNTTGGVCYQAKGISSTSDWKQTSN